jgi:hypothetical protein
LGVVNFDTIFQNVLAGWEGSSHDSRVLQDARNKGLPFVLGKFHLGDVGCALAMRCLVPYRGVRYHLKEWIAGGRTPVNKEELFNLRHSSLRNVVERVYGVVQKRFPIFKKMSPYPFTRQVDIVTSCCMLHNFIVRNQLYSDMFDILDDDEFDLHNDDANVALPQPYVDDPAGHDAAVMWRDGIAQRMWDDYQNELAARNLP